jgi:hypothetical protein
VKIIERAMKRSLLPPSLALLASADSRELISLGPHNIISDGGAIVSTIMSR